MLTGTQIEVADTRELERLSGCIEAELERRRVRDRMEDGSDRQVLERHDAPRGIYQWEMVRCGHPERCKKG